MPTDTQSSKNIDPDSNRERTAPSYGRILKSTALISGASAFDILQKMARTKVVALLLGPSGVGLSSVYTSIIWVASTLSGMGVSNSGVRQIAEAVASQEPRRVARIVTTLRRSTWILGSAAAVVMAILCYPICRITFASGEHKFAVALLSLAVLFGTVANGWSAVLQGLRKIGDLARANILGGMIGSFLGILLIWFFRANGIVPMLVVTSAASYAVTRWIARKTPIHQADISWRESYHESQALLGLGIAFMASGLMNALLAYLTRTMVLRMLGLEGAGHYAAAYTISAIYAGFILQAMGADFFPRLTEVAKDNSQCNRMVNEQAEISLLLAMPGLLATLALAPWVIRVFYAGNFEPAIAILRWQALGVLCRVSSWPMGFILLAKGDRKSFLLTEVFMNFGHVIFLLIGIGLWGLTGTGIAFLAGNFTYWLIIFFVVRRISGFRWSRVNLNLAAWMLPLVVATFAASIFLAPFVAQLVGSLIALACGYACLRILIRKVPDNRIARVFSWIT